MSASVSIVSSLVELNSPERRKFLSSLSDSETLSLFYDWKQWARPNQIAPEGTWSNWLCLSGRGWGKTRVGAEWVRHNAENHPDRKELRIALVAPVAGDARKVMVEGESGIMAISPPWARPSFNPSLSQLTWPSGAIGILFSADEPDRLRGPQFHLAWSDEIAAWGGKGGSKREGGSKGGETWDNLQMGLRLGDNPQNCITTTPRPIQLIRELKADPATVISSGSTFENSANVARKFLDRMVRKYAGTRLGRQELYAEVLDDTPGALWTRDLIERHRVDGHPDLIRIVIGVDPAVTSGEDSDNTGIVVVGLGANYHAYVLRDLTCKLTPIGWATRVCNVYTHYKADRVVGEVNNGGDLVEANLRSVDPLLSYKSVHASRGKRVRAEPIASLYEQGYVHHVRDTENPHHLTDLEDMMTNFVSDQMDKSPDNLDALVWALTELYLEPEEESGMVSYYEPVRISPF
jgi:phage terminase large subunit-like protein